MFLMENTLNNILKFCVTMCTALIRIFITLKQKRNVRKFRTNLRMPILEIEIHEIGKFSKSVFKLTMMRNSFRSNIKSIVQKHKKFFSKNYMAIDLFLFLS